MTPPPTARYYPLFFGNTTNAYGRQLDMAIDKAFALGMDGVYHDEAGVTATGCTSHRRWSHSDAA